MIRVIAKFSLKSGQKDKAVETARELIALTRKEDGCAHYDLAESATDENLLVILEAWESQTALDAHSASDHFKRLVPQLTALCEGPPAVDALTQII